MSRQIRIVEPPALDADGPRPLVSVIIPTRNRAHLLRRSVNSVLAQTYLNLELIVVNDASTDGTRAVLESITDPRLRVLHRTQNSCAGAARNAGVALARGELVSFHDDDDYWFPHKLERQVPALLAAPAETALCLCGRLFLEHPGSRVQYIGGPQRVAGMDYRQGNGQDGPDLALIATPGWLLRKSALDRVGGFDERIRSWDDWELGLRLWRDFDFIVVDEPLYLQDHVVGGGLMRLERARADDIVVIDQKHGDLWAHDARVRARHLHLRGLALSVFDPRPAGRAELWQAVRTYPLAWKSWAALLLSYLPQHVGPALAQRIRGWRARWWQLRHG